jgi:hypothetical protein
MAPHRNCLAAASKRELRSATISPPNRTEGIYKLKTLLALMALLAAGVSPVLADEKPRLTYELGEMQYDANGNASFVISIRNMTAKPLMTANFICEFITEDMTPFDPQVIQFEDIPAKGRMKKRIRTDAEAYSATCDLRGGRVLDGGEGDGTFWFE